MKLQAKKPAPTISPNNKIQEIAKILINAIYRLEAKENSKNPHFPLDNNDFQSTHGN